MPTTLTPLAELNAAEIAADEFAEFLYQEGARHRHYDFAERLLARLVGTDDEPGPLMWRSEVPAR